MIFLSTFLFLSCSDQDKVPNKPETFTRSESLGPGGFDAGQDAAVSQHDGCVAVIYVVGTPDPDQDPDPDPSDLKLNDSGCRYDIIQPPRFNPYPWWPENR